MGKRVNLLYTFCARNYIRCPNDHHGFVSPEWQRATSRCHIHWLAVVVTIQVLLHACRSSLKVQCHIFLGWPLHFLSSVGTQSMLTLTGWFTGIERTCPAYFSLCSVTMSWSGYWLERWRTSSFVTWWCQLIPSIFLRELWRNTFILCAK